jgi:hypothetical protein
MAGWTYDSILDCYTVTDCPLNCDGDGANGQTGGIACYVPAGSGLQSLDLLANAGHPGNWWGLACDAGGNPFIQGPNDPAPGAYISTTSYEIRFLPDGVTPRPANDPNRYLDAASVPFIVVPGAFARAVPGIVKGCKCEVEYKGQVELAMVGDTGPDFGEFSLALCKQFDPAASCHGTAISSGVTVRVWPGVEFPGYALQAS